MSNFKIQEAPPVPLFRRPWNVSKWPAAQALESVCELLWHELYSFWPNKAQPVTFSKPGRLLSLSPSYHYW